MGVMNGLACNLRLIFCGDPRYQNDAQYQRNVVTMIMYAFLPTVLIFSVINYAHARFTLASIELVASFLLCINLYMTKNHDWFLPVARWGLIFLGIVVFVALFVDGGIGSVGAYWSLAYPFMAFALMGARFGWAWIGLFMLIESGVFIAHAEGALALPYSNDVLALFPIMLLFFYTHREHL